MTRKADWLRKLRADTRRMTHATGGAKPARKARRSKLNYEPHSTPYQQWLRKLRADTRGGGGICHSGTTTASGPGHASVQHMGKISV